MKRYYCITLLLLCTFISSCSKDWLDAKTDKSLTVPSTLNDYEQLLDDASTFNQRGSSSLGEIANDNVNFIPMWIQYFSNGEMNAITWSHNLPYLNMTEWNGSYQRIFHANLILEGLAELNPKNSDEAKIKNNIYGGALFQRGRTIFELTQIFAPPFSEKTASTDLGVPLKLESDINLPPVRKNLSETYLQAISDIMKAAELLPIAARYKTRASKPAVFALLARIYLNMENYELANLYADSCLQLTNTLIDFSTLNAAASLPIGLFNSEVIFHSRNVGATPLFSFAVAISETLYNEFSLNDLRHDIYFRKNVDGTISFKGFYDNKNSPPFFDGIAVDEIYLIRAETYARLNNIAEAAKDLNTLLRTRYKTGEFVDYSFTNSEEALQIILKERRKELILRGQRWSDLRRLNKDDRFKITITRTINGKTYTLEPNSYKYTFPIPDDVIELSGMQQNPGWEK